MKNDDKIILGFVVISFVGGIYAGIAHPENRGMAGIIASIWSDAPWVFVVFPISFFVLSFYFGEDKIEEKTNEKQEVTVTQPQNIVQAKPAEEPPKINQPAEEKLTREQEEFLKRFEKLEREINS